MSCSSSCPPGASPDLHGTERIVSVEATGGTWCAWSTSPDCPLPCSGASVNISADGRSIEIGGDTRWDDNSGSCSFRLHICGQQ
ncbi:MAG: hypothetical protein HY901_21965 [Deltaproteobacteria bacterium]|nr:hypothetical protein [Deltaproteobacteria bacterium]